MPSVFTISIKESTGLASISVVIPAYNAQETVAAAITSVLQQSVSVQEIIVVDDGSTDDTAGVAQQFSLVRVERVSNGGPSRARNHGLDLAVGEWIAFLDADDRWHPEKLAIQLRGSGCGAELIACDWVRGEDFPPVPKPVPKSVLSYRELLTMNQFQTSTVLMTRELTFRLGGFDANLDGAEDWDFWLRASQETTVMKIDWPLVQYRDVATGYSKDVWRVYETMQPMLDKHRGTDAISPKDFSTLEAWHHLRFWVAFRLAHQPQLARVAWRKAWQKRLRWSVPGAFAYYLFPFLLKRLRAH